MATSQGSLQGGQDVDLLESSDADVEIMDEGETLYLISVPLDRSGEEQMPSGVSIQALEEMEGFPPVYEELIGNHDFELHHDDYSESSVFCGFFPNRQRFLKYFREGESDSMFLELLRKWDGEEPFGRERRMEAVENAERLREIGAFGIPLLMHADEGIAELELIDGEEFYQEVQEADPQKAFELGHELGRRVRLSHENDLALRDFNKGNFIIEYDSPFEDPEFFYVDSEYFKEDATFLDKKWDLLIFNHSSIEYLDGNYKHTMNGFMEAYGLSDFESVCYTGLGVLNEFVRGDNEKGKETMQKGFERLMASLNPCS